MTQARYFAGEANSLGRVAPLGCQTFADFAKDILGQPQILNVTRAEFWAMDPKERDVKKRVRYAIPAVMDDTGSRTYDHALHCNLVALDIDEAEDARRFYKDPGALVQLLAPYSFVAHTTAKSTEEKPRIRIYVDADKIPVPRYGEAIGYIGGLLGVKANKESKVAVQPMFLPTLFRGDDPMLVHPVFAEHLQGRPLRESDVQTELTAGNEQPDQRAEQANPDGTPDDAGALDYLEWLREPLANVTEEDVRGALEFLDPDMDFHKWTEIAMALKHQFRDDSETGYKLFDEWSAKAGSKYEGSEDTAAKWRHVRSATKGRAPVTIRTLFHRAKEEGWVNDRLSAQCYADTLNWIEDGTRTPDALTKQGLQRIVNTAMVSPLERDLLLSKLHARMCKLGVKVTRGELKKHMLSLLKTQQRKTQEGETKSLPDKQLPPWARGFVYVSQHNEFYHRAADARFKPESLDNTYNFALTSPDAKNGMPETTAKAFLLNIARIPRVHFERYDPAHPGEVIVQDGPIKFLNTYRACYPEPSRSMQDEAGAIFYEHATNLIPEQRERHLLIDWLAYHVQCPGGKIRWAVLLQGAQGCGKTLIADAMRAVLGKSNVTTVDANVVKNSDFNSWAYGAQICTLEEIRIVGESRYEVMNKMKPCITNDVVSINRKNKELIELPNVTNYLMLTNYRDALAVQDGDRRYFVLYSAIQRKEQVRALGPNYFKALYRMITTQGAGLRAWLEDWEISEEFNANGHAPETAYLRELQEAAASPLAAAVVQAIADKSHPLVAADLLSVRHLRDLMANEGISSNEQHVSAVLREHGWKRLERARLPGGDRVTLWVPFDSALSVDNARKLAEERYAQIGTEAFGNLEDVLK